MRAARRRLAHPLIALGCVAATAIALTTSAEAQPTGTAGASAVSPRATATPTPAAGARRNATRLNFSISGTAGLSVDVATGNALFTDQLISLPGVNAAVPISLSYNSSVWNSTVPSAVSNTGSGWAITGFDQRMVANADGSVTYYGPGGLTGVFTPITGGFTAPSQFRATLKTVTGGGWTLTEHASQNKLTFNSGGRLTSSADRNGNTTSFDYTASGGALDVIATRGGVTARKLSIALSGGRISTLTQTDGAYSTRTVKIGYSSLGNLASVTDVVGGVTRFDGPSDNGQVVTITNPAGATTTLSFTGSKVSQVAQSNAAGTSVTRLNYPSSTQTLVADPTTSQSQAVSAVAHTTYNFNSTTNLVTSVTDQNSHSRSTSYTPLTNVATSTPAAGGATTFGYGANGNESLTSVATAAGATSSAAYTGTGASQYLPSSSTDDASNATKYTYNGAGNQLTTAQGTGPQATVGYNTDGTASSSQSPGATLKTTFGYDTLHNLTSTTPPTGTSLNVRNYTWDPYGRLHTATDGRGSTLTYSYDDADRITKVDYSDTATHDVTFSYDALGRILTRVDASGTTTNTWDALGKLLSTVNTAGGGTIRYSYDLAGALATEADGRGTTSYGYDAAHQLTSMTYPKSGATQSVQFANDANGRRTETWLQSNPAHSVWAAHTRTTYDGSGRVTAVLSERGPVSAPVTALNETVCYSAGSVAPACGTATTADRSKIQWTKDSVSGETTSYTYDGNGRLTKAIIAGGSNPRTFSYTYDTAGNRLTSAVTGSSPSSKSLTYNAGNQITTSGYTYDGAGNRLHSADGSSSTYNTAGQLATRSDTASQTTYTYAGTNADELVSQVTTGGDTYRYAYGRADQNGLPEIEQITRVSGGTSATAYVAHDPTGKPVLLQTSTGTDSLYIYDAQDNPVGLSTDFNAEAYAYRYDPFGAANLTYNSGGTGVPQNPYLFGGGLQDRASGLVKFGQRWYDPTTGSWTQQDAQNAPLDPGNSDRYAFASDDPINNSDPTGEFSFGDVLAGAGLVLGVASLFFIPEATIPALITVGGFETGVAGAAYQYGCDAVGGC